MNKLGINKRLYDKRIELGYSLKEAAIHLDISKIRLNLIENGYIQVKSKELKSLFIQKYNLEQNFFDDDLNGYPTILDKKQEEDISKTKIVKLLKNFWFKIGSIVLSLAFVSMFAIGLVRYESHTPKNLFSERYIQASEYVNETGIDHLSIKSNTGSMLVCNYKSIESNEEPDENGFYFESINFFPKYDDYLGYTFFTAYQNINLNALLGLDIENAIFSYESRYSQSYERIHFYVYTYDPGFPALQYLVAHLSIDKHYDSNQFKYVLCEIKDAMGNLVVDSVDSFYGSLYKSAFEAEYPIYKNKISNFVTQQTNLGYSNLDEFSTDQIQGIRSYNKYYGSSIALITCGVVFATICLALFILSLIVTTKFGMKVYDAVSNIGEDNLEFKEMQTKKKAKLPKNNWPAPFVPETIVRIIAVLLVITASLSLYYIFNAIVSGDIVGTFESLKYRATVASFTTVGMILIFFTKLDIIQNKKSTFLLNFALFFAGFIFYVMTILVSKEITGTPALARFSIILDFLPGNIVWGILAFNLLTTILLSKPKFDTNDKFKLIKYRLLSLLPLAYMIASSVIQIGRKALGWELPFAVSSLFFTKAVIITVFTILYVAVVYVYRRIVDKKYGKENAEMYVLGNRYQFIQNALIAGIIVILGLTDFLLGKYGVSPKMGFGSNTGIFFLIPLILLYHPHRGARNAKWDLAFNTCYFLSLMAGILLIIPSIVSFITTL